MPAPHTDALMAPMPMSTQEQKKANRRLALILASVALAFGLGFAAKILLIGG